MVHYKGSSNLERLCVLIVGLCSKSKVRPVPGTIIAAGVGTFLDMHTQFFSLVLLLE